MQQTDGRPVQFARTFPNLNIEEQEEKRNMQLEVETQVLDRIAACPSVTPSQKEADSTRPKTTPPPTRDRITVDLLNAAELRAAGEGCVVIRMECPLDAGDQLGQPKPAQVPATATRLAEIHTAVTGANADLIADAARLYLRPGDKVADVTYGRGVFWRKLDLTSVDFHPSDRITCPNAAYDFRHLPTPITHSTTWFSTLPTATTRGAAILGSRVTRTTRPPGD